MNKPANLIVEETKANIVKIINESGLPPFLIEPIIKDLYNQINMPVLSLKVLKYLFSLKLTPILYLEQTSWKHLIILNLHFWLLEALHETKSGNNEFLVISYESHWLYKSPDS